MGEPEISELGSAGGSFGAAAAQVTQVLYLHLSHFQSPPQSPQPLCERKLGFVVPVLPEGQRVGVSRGW